MFDIRFDERTCIMHVRTEGFWSLATLAQFTATMIAKGTAARLRHGQYAVLTDARAFGVQHADVAKGLNALVERGQMINKGPNATVVADMLSKLQAGRVLTPSNNRVFTDMDEATAWLNTEWVSRRAA